MKTYRLDKTSRVSKVRWKVRNQTASVLPDPRKQVSDWTGSTILTLAERERFENSIWFDSLDTSDKQMSYFTFRRSFQATCRTRWCCVWNRTDLLFLQSSSICLTDGMASSRTRGTTTYGEGSCRFGPCKSLLTIDKGELIVRLTSGEKKEGVDVVFLSRQRKY